MINRIIAEEHGVKPEKENGEHYVVEMSADQKEYVALQKIPCYGMHCYMAVSNEPCNEWDRPPTPPVAAGAPERHLTYMEFPDQHWKTNN
ncbi:hypothetical protein ANN_10979 [Periplaneta americana]|uniref:Uncharacterized protein n=1 Tax=Periplaneta americana TaxID=6978 RepID=A0ABQ8T3S1_PERAM|nr:hypothetical protein ANN_10979 [Periplaneta americana]